MDTAYFFKVRRANMAKKKYETQFSIYKVDFERSIKYFEEEYDTKILSYSELEDQILNTIKKEISNRKKNEIVNFDNNGFKGLVFKTYHYPTWCGMIDNMLEDKIDLSNIHISYILTYKKDENIFLLTGGLGSNYISEYTQKNYGLYLLPKIMKENSPVIKSVLENRMSGNKLSSKHSNRNVTTISTENDMSSIFRELSLEINKEIIELLGIETDENKKIKNLNLIAKDSFVIRKSISIEKLIIVLNKLIEIEKNDDNFSLGYFIDSKKNGYSYKDLNEQFIQYLMRGIGENFILVGDDYSEYCVGGNSYVIQDNEQNVIYHSDIPITINDLYKNCLPEPITKASVEKLLKYNLIVYNDKEIILYPTKIKQCMQGYIEDENRQPFFLFNDKWLMFDTNYIDNLDKEFKKSYTQMINIDKKLKDILSNKEANLTEDTYNKTFENSDEIILAHTVLSNYIELADLIYYDDDNLYLIHNKLKFQGSGARDVLNQILTSAEFINHYMMDKKDFIEKYYEDILKKYPNNKIKDLTKEEFVELFNKPNIYYVAGFMEKLSDNTDSNYAKYITIDASKKLIEKGYQLLLFDVNK